MFHRASNRPYIARALMLGFAVGLRSQMANAALSLAHGDAPRSARWTRWILFRSPLARTANILGAVGELAGDKFPNTPSRIAPAPLAGRVAFGALAGATIGSERKGMAPILTGAVLGGIGALAGSYGGYHTRKWLVEASGSPDLPVALAGDAIAAMIAHQAAG